MPRTEARKLRGLGTQDEQHLQELAELYVPHPRMVSTISEVRHSLERARRDRHLTLLVGPTGVGKTTAWQQLGGEFAAAAAGDASPDRLGSIYVRLEAKAGAYRSASLDRFLLLAADEPLIERKQILPGKPGKMLSLTGTNEGRRQALLNVLRFRRPSAIVIDEAQHFGYLTGRGAELALDDLKTLADSSDVPLLFLGTYAMAQFSGLSGQLARRTQDVHFARYDGSAESWLEFLSTLNYITSRVSFDFDPLDDEGSKDLYAGCIGCIGLLMRWLVRSYERCLRSGRRAIAREDLDAERWQAGKLSKQLDDIRHGESRMSELIGDFDALYQSLGLSLPAGKQKRGTRPGTRSPVRDVVGSLVGESKARSA